MYISTPNGTWTQASGKAIVETGIPMEISARFRIASITKTFVSVVVLQLAQEGKLKLDDAINKFLPKEIIAQLPNSNQITIRATPQPHQWFS
ncbi:MAG: serine hydrolase domain-containing protein [Potamolinea sp.]